VTVPAEGPLPTHDRRSTPTSTGGGRGQSWGGKVLLACGATLVAILLLEGAARALRPPREGVIPHGIGRFDPVLGWSLQPSSHGVSSRTGYPIEYRINSKGLRDDETAYEKPAGRFRIVLLGDSRTFGFGVPIHKHFSTLLERYFKDLEVINMGVGGFGVDQELLCLRTEGLRYQPDLVMAYVAHYGNHRHMYATRWGKEKPRFLRRDGRLILENSPVPLPKPRHGTLRGLWQWALDHSRTLQIVHSRLVRPEPQEAGQDAKNMEDAAFRQELYALGEELVGAMHDEAATRGIPFVLVTHIEELHRAMHERKVHSLDVSRPLANPAFALPHGLQHINESGNGVLAWEIARYLESSGLIPARHLRADIERQMY
jgi:hypothetical protein